jgi:hypothetical protein
VLRTWSSRNPTFPRREEHEEIKLRGVDLVSESTDLKLGAFTLLQNWIPTKIFSLKRKRGVVALSTTVIVPTVPGACT